MKELGTPELFSKMNQALVGILTVVPNGTMPMGTHLFDWCLSCVLISFFVACVATPSLAPGLACMRVIR